MFSAGRLSSQTGVCDHGLILRMSIRYRPISPSRSRERGLAPDQVVREVLGNWVKTRWA